MWKKTHVMKKMIPIFLTFFILTIPNSVFATPYNMGWSAGDQTYTLENKFCTQSTNAALSSSGIQFSQNGSVTFDFYLPFHSRSVKFTFLNNRNAVLTLNTGIETYQLELTGTEGENTFLFGESLGYEAWEYYLIGGSYEATREFVERKGERILTITASADVEITGIVFEKEKTPIPSAPFTLSNLTDNEKALETAVLIDRNASMLMVNGGRRYINNADVKERPLEQDGKLYLPVNTLARALGYYYEDIPQKNYVLLRKEPFEFTFLNGQCFLKKNTGDKQELENRLIYKDGRAFLPIRYFAEILGETVGYKDGLVAIDNKFSVSNILNDVGILNYAKNEFSPFYPEKKSANTFYVAQTANANDNNNGSIFAPFKTLSKASTVAQAGDTVIIREGIYREVLIPKNDGTANNPITFRAAEGEKVVISANEKLDSLAYYKDNIYITQVDWDLGDGRNQVFINNQSLVEARYPNGPALTSGENGSPKLSSLWPVKGDMGVSYQDKNMAVVSETSLNQEENHWQGGYYVGLLGYGYALSTARIDSSEYGKLKVKDVSKAWWWTNESTHWNFGYITGHINCLDAPGEWILKDGTLYMIYPEGVEPSSVSVEVKKRQLVVDMAERKFIRMEGIETIGGGIRMNNSEMCTLNEMNMRYISHYTYSTDQRDGFIDEPYNTLNKDGAPPRGEMGIYVGGTDNIIINSQIDHSAGAGIFGVGLYTYVENNILNDCGYMGSYISGITFTTQDWTPLDTPRGGHAVFNNTVYNNGRSCWNIGVSQKMIQPGDGLKIAPFIPYELAYNDFHDGILASLDTGITYEFAALMGHNKLKSAMHHNLVYYTVEKQEANPFSFGIYHDGYSQGVDTYNNLVFTTQPDTYFTSYSIYAQPLNTAVANHDFWNNALLGTVAGGKDALTYDKYPNKQPFYAGAKRDGDIYLANYELAKNQADNTLSVKNAVLSDGVKLEDGLAVFGENDQYICFENVDFGEAKNEIKIDFSGDKYHTNDAIEIVIGNDITSGKVISRQLTVTSPYKNHMNIYQTSFPVLGGIQNVYIRMKDYKSAKIASIALFAKNVDYSMAAKVYGGTFDSYDRTNVEVNNTLVPKAYYNVEGDATNPMVNNTWPGTVLEYKNITLSADSNTLVIASGSGGVYAGQLVEVRLGSPTATPIARYCVDKDDWRDYTPVEISLGETIRAGTYNIYLTFAKEPEYGNNKSSNLYYFAFKKIQ